MTDVNVIRDTFKDKPYTYFVTIKPPSDDDKLTYMKHEFYKYLLPRCTFWIVHCKSEKGYKHYHGILKLSHVTHNQATADKFKKAYQRKVNRDIGFNLPLKPLLNIDAVIKYIKQQQCFPQDITNL